MDQARLKWHRRYEQKCARDTIRAVLDDARDSRLAGGHFPCRRGRGAPASRSPDIVTYDDWRRLDRFERSAGESAGRPRVKLTGVKQMLQYLSQS